MINVWSSDWVEMARHDNVPLPMDEEVFLNLDPATANGIVAVSDSSRGSSLLAQMIGLNDISLEVRDHIKDLAATPLTPASHRRVEDLAVKLSKWYKALPGHLRPTEDNLRCHAAKGLGRLFVAVHLSGYHVGQVLFYPYLDERLQQCALTCKRFATGLSELLYASMATPGCGV